MLAVCKREIQSYFYTPIGYVFMGFFLVVSGVFFALGNISSRSSSMLGLLSNLTIMFMLLVPVLTMKLLSEEKKNKSDQLLLTSPVSITSIVVGKFLAACIVFAVTLGLTLLYTIILAMYGRPSFAETFAGYLGFLLMGCSFISIGLLMSAFTENQVSSAVSTFAVILVLWLADSIAPNLTIPYLSFLPSALEWISIYSRFSGFAMGIVSLSGIVFYVTFCAAMVFLAVRVIEKRRWSEG